MVGVRWVAADNNDSAYVVLNNINTAKFRHFDVDGQPAGHDNFNYVVGTWQHRFNQAVHTKTAAYTCGSVMRWWAARRASGRRSPLRGGGRGAVLPACR